MLLFIFIIIIVVVKLSINNIKGRRKKKKERRRRREKTNFQSNINEVADFNQNYLKGKWLDLIRGSFPVTLHAGPGHGDPSTNLQLFFSGPRESQGSGRSGKTLISRFSGGSERQ